VNEEDAHKQDVATIDDVRRRMLSRRKIVFQALGFLAGLVLIAICFRTAFQDGADWSRIREASPALLTALLVTGLLSTVLDGMVFWAVMRPYHRLGFMEVQGANMTASFLNYGPVRLGTIFRIIFHARVDKIPLIPILAWFAAITVTTAACMGSVFVATLLVGKPGVSWACIVALLLAISGVSLWFVSRSSMVRRRANGIERMFGDPQALTAGLVGRLFVLASICVRMSLAAQILELDIETDLVIMISITALLSSFIPLGRFGWREATVTLVTARFAAESLGDVDVTATAAQLALVESAGEALVVVPLGTLTAIWAFRRMLATRRTGSTSSPAASDRK